MIFTYIHACIHACTCIHINTGTQECMRTCKLHACTSRRLTFLRPCVCPCSAEAAPTALVVARLLRFRLRPIVKQRQQRFKSRSRPSTADLMDRCQLIKAPLLGRSELLFARSCSEFSTLRRYAFRPAVGLAVLARTVPVHVCMILCIDAYLYAPVSVHYGYTCTYSHRQTRARTYAHAHAPVRKPPLSAH